MADPQHPPSPPATTGLVPPFLRRSLITPWTGLGVAAVVGVACASFWHPHAPDLGGMAARQMASMQSNTASADSTRPEAPDPSPTAFPKRSVVPMTVAQVIRPQASPSPVAMTQNVAVAQAAAVVSQPVPTSVPTPPSNTTGDFGEPDSTELNPDAGKGSAAVQHTPPQAPVAADRENGIGYVPAVSRDEVQQGTVIHCRFTSKVDAEHPGQVEGEILEAIDSSLDSSVEVIPAGTGVVGQYGTASSGDTRLMIVWTRLNFPDGTKFEFAEPATDELGSMGVGGTVNTHAGKAAAQALLYTVINGLGNAFSRSNTVLLGGSSIGQGISGQQPPQIKPDIYIPAGALFNIVAGRDLPLARYRVRP